MNRLPSDLDRYDHAIIDVLSRDGRVSITELARRIGLTKTPCQARVKRLEDAGFITGYRAILDPVKLGRDHIAFVEVKLSDTRAPALEAFNKAVIAIPEVEQCHLIAGGFDYLLKVRTRSIRDYADVLSDAISALPHVAHTSSFVSMQAVKEEEP